MAERNRLSNGRFTHDLNNWTTSSASYSAGDGDDHYGVAVLADGGYIEQTFSVRQIRTHDFHVAVKPVGGALVSGNVQAIVSDGDSNTVLTQDLTGSSADTWEENSFSAGLASGTTYTLKIINNNFGANVKIDDAWIWFVPETRAEIASKVENKLARLASERSYSTTASGADTEGDYTDAIDAGLRMVGAINPVTGKPDVRYLDSQNVHVAIDYVEKEMLERLYRDYSVEVDVTTGQYSEKRSQIKAAIAELIGAGDDADSGPGGAVVIRKMTYGNN